MPCTSDSRQNVLHSFLYTVSSHRSRPLFIYSVGGWSIFYSCEKGAVVALHSNILVMHLGTGHTAGHPAMVVVKKERASYEAKSSVCFS